MSIRNQINKVKANSLAQNRAEEFGYDLSKDFVLPPIFEMIDFKKSLKPKIFIGGRGCGKTMLLRYLSHHTSFSKTKKDVPIETIDNIGLYWKVDTHMVHQLQKRGLEEDIWQSAFEHIVTLFSCIEVFKSLESIAYSNFEFFEQNDLDKLEFGFLSKIKADGPKKFNELKEHFNSKVSEFEIWLRNVRKGEMPDFYPRSFLLLLINDLKKECPIFTKSVYNIYFDEYENLIEYQQEIVNTWVKHSESPIIFHLAMKRNAFRTKKTVGEESLIEVHDYRVHDLEDYLEGKKGFNVFAAEILLYRLQGQVNFKGYNFDPSLLVDPLGFEKRKSDDYRTIILEIVDSIFPSLSKKELANSIADDKNLTHRLFEKINAVLKSKESNRTANDFVFYDDLRISLISLSLLHRDNINPEKIYDEIIKFKQGKTSKFNNSTDWIQNNFVGSYLYFYSSLNRVCPLYTGFRTFCEMSNGNIRHLTELCYKTFLRASDSNTADMIVDIWKITVDHQAQAAKQASTTFLNEIKTFGRYGNQLHTFVQRLGTLFSLAHKNPRQSEPEQNHFSIVGGSNKSENSSLLLNEALKWSVLFEYKSTKKKMDYNPDYSDYVLNPIYAPYFHISYRKKRKLDFSTVTLDILFSGSLDEYEGLLRSYKSRWNLSDNIKEHNLFSDLNI
ncbi:MAG: hypothetical protein RIM83_09215 [Allomuricauda sp.]